MSRRMFGKSCTVLAIALIVTAFTGCGSKAKKESNAASGDGADKIVWKLKTKTDDGLEIQIGHRGNHFEAAQEIKVVATITKDGKPVEDYHVTVNHGHDLPPISPAAVTHTHMVLKFRPAANGEVAHYENDNRTYIILPRDAAGKKYTIRCFFAQQSGSLQTAFDFKIDVAE